MISVVEPVATPPNGLAVSAEIVRAPKNEDQPSLAQTTSDLWDCEDIGHHLSSKSECDEREAGFILGES